MILQRVAPGLHWCSEHKWWEPLLQVHEDQPLPWDMAHRDANLDCAWWTSQLLGRHDLGSMNLEWPDMRDPYLWHVCRMESAAEECEDLGGERRYHQRQGCSLGWCEMHTQNIWWTPAWSMNLNLCWICLSWCNRHGKNMLVSSAGCSQGIQKVKAG